MWIHSYEELLVQMQSESSLYEKVYERKFTQYTRMSINTLKFMKLLKVTHVSYTVMYIGKKIWGHYQKIRKTLNH